MSTRIAIAVVSGLLTIGSVARAGAVLDLVPDDPGPYYGGESLTVDFWLHSNRPYDVRLRSVQFSFLDTAPALRGDPTFAFDFSSLGAGGEYALTFPDLPIPRTGRFIDCLCPEAYLLLPGEGALHIGSLGVELPMDPGVYSLDALNHDEPDALLSAYILAIYTDPHELWRAFTGDITGGAYDFIVVPEPATLWFLVLGGVAVVRRRGSRRVNIRRNNIFARFAVIAGLLGVAPVAHAGAIVELVPDDPGPYYGGESVTVDVWLHNEELFDVGLKLVQLDFSDTDPALSLRPTFSWDFSSLPDDDAYQAFLITELPLPRAAMGWDCLCPGLYLALPSEGSLHIGSLEVELPVGVGTYDLDALNADEAGEVFGARIIGVQLPSLGPSLYWSAFTGEITGRGHDFAVIPEPHSLVLVILGGLGILVLPRKKPRTCLVLGISAIVVLNGVRSTARAQPAVIPAETVMVNVDSGPVGPSGVGRPLPERFRACLETLM